MGWMFFIVGISYLLVQLSIIALFCGLVSKLRQKIFPRIRTDICIRCQYPLEELTKGTCPECGVEIGWNAINAEVLRRRTALSWRKMPRSVGPALVWVGLVTMALVSEPLGAPTVLHNLPYLMMLWLAGLVTFVLLQARGVWRASEEGRRLEGWIGLVGMAVVWAGWLLVSAHWW